MSVGIAGPTGDGKWTWSGDMFCPYQATEEEADLYCRIAKEYFERYLARSEAISRGQAVPVPDEEDFSIEYREVTDADFGRIGKRLLKRTGVQHDVEMAE